MLANWQRKKIIKSEQHQDRAFQEVNDLVIKQRDGRVVTLVSGETLLEFCSCCYLGLDVDSRLVRASTKNLEQYGVSFPVARTRMRTENLLHLEKLLSNIFLGYATTFVSLHLTHLGCLPILASGKMPSFPIKDNGMTFIMDKTAHASIQINRGLLEQFGSVELVDFSSHEQLEAAFKSAHDTRKTPISLSDSIGSMGGIAPVKFIMEMCDTYQGYAYFDDAHGTSIFGKNGCGYVLKELDHLFHPRLILTASLSKAFGTNGAVIVLPTAADEQMIKRFASTYLFGNPPPFAIIDAAIESANIHLSDEIYERQTQLWENVAYFDGLLHNHIVNSGKISPIRGIFMGDEWKAIDCAKKLRQRGFAVTTAMYPTVAKGKSMLRVAISCLHKKEEIYKLCENVKEILEAH